MSLPPDVAARFAQLCAHHPEVVVEAEAWDERAAILEDDEGMPRAKAERLAFLMLVLHATPRDEE